jgi:glycosyltransferase involved in cell wall biosynthesis
MRIGINLSVLIPGKIGGHEKYLRNLIHYFPRIEKRHAYYLFVKGPCSDTFEYGHNVKKVLIPDVYGDELTEELRSKIKENAIDLWFSPLLVADPFDLPVINIFCIPDLQHEFYPDFFSKEVLEWRKKYFLKSAMYADAIITISAYSRKTIIDRLHINKNKISCFYEGVPHYYFQKLNPKKIESVKNEYNLPDDYIFYPANTWPHKNHLTLFKAIQEYNLTHPQKINLVFTGYKSDAHDRIIKKLKEQDIAQHIFYLGYITDEDMPYIYKNAACLVFPSLFEGFGIPLVEAMYSECPILCSNVTSIPEIAGDAALYFNPLNHKDIAEKIDVLLRDSVMRNTLIENGKKRYALFSYEACAKDTMELFNRALDYFSIDTANPLISIIMPSYNQGKYIERSIRSVVEQNYEKVELIIVDGGSTDATLETIKKYADTYPFRIKWISEKDRGQADAINKGLRIAKGDILAYLNSDDTYEQGAFKKIVDFFKQNPQEAFVYGMGRHISSDDTHIENYPNAQTDRNGLYHTCSICQPAAFWRKSLLKEIGFFSDDLHFALDYDYWIRTSSKFTLNFIREHLANTRLYPETKTSGSAVKCHNEILNVIKRNYGTVSENWISGWAHTYIRAKLNLNRDKKAQDFIFRALIVLLCIYKTLRYNKKLSRQLIDIFKRWMGRYDLSSNGKR